MLIYWRNKFYLTFIISWGTNNQISCIQFSCISLQMKYSLINLLYLYDISIIKIEEFEPTYSRNYVLDMNKIRKVFWFAYGSSKIHSKQNFSNRIKYLK